MDLEGRKPFPAVDSIKLTAQKNLPVSVFSKLRAGVNPSGILSESGSCMKQTVPNCR